MANLLLDTHFGRTVTYMIADAYEDSLTAWGDDFYWSLTIDAQGSLMLDIDQCHGYYGMRMTLLRIQGRWTLLESTEEAYMVWLEDLELLALEGDPPDRNAWLAHARTGVKLRVSATTIGIDYSGASASTDGNVQHS
jgi:hypothetical protein